MTGFRSAKDDAYDPRPPALNGVHIILYCWNLLFSIRQKHRGFRIDLLEKHRGKRLLRMGLSYIPPQYGDCPSFLITGFLTYQTGPTVLSERTLSLPRRNPVLILYRRDEEFYMLLPYAAKEAGWRF